MRAECAACAANQRGAVDWTEEFYDQLQNKVGGGKPKMRWYFGEHGWPTSSVLGCVHTGAHAMPLKMTLAAKAPHSGPT